MSISTIKTRESLENLKSYLIKAVSRNPDAFTSIAMASGVSESKIKAIAAGECDATPSEHARIALHA